MEISIEKIVEIVTREVLRELSNRGFNIEQAIKVTDVKTNLLNIDMNGFKTPVLTENKLFTIDENITKLIVPAKTVITPGARYIIKQKNLTLIYKS